MPRFVFVGPDPIDHFHLGRVAPGDVVDCDEAPAGPWTPEQPPPRTEHGSDAPETPEEV